MKLSTLFLAAALAAPVTMAATAREVGHDFAEAAVDLSGRWILNTELSDARPPAPEPGAAAGRGSGGPGGRPPGPGGGGFPGRSPGGARGDRPNPEDMARMRDAMRAVLEAPAQLVITRRDDEVVFTANDGDVMRVLVTGTTMKTLAGGAEHEVKAAYKDGALVIESVFGSAKLVDRYRLMSDGAQLERATEMTGAAPRGGEQRRPLRRIYDRARPDEMN